MNRFRAKKVGKESKEQKPDQPGDQQPMNEPLSREDVPLLNPDRMRRFVVAFIKNRRTVLEKLFDSDKRNNE